MQKAREYSRSEIEAVINEWIFNERDRAIIRRRLFDGITHEKLAEEFDLSVAQIKRIIYKAEDKIFSKLK